MKNSSWTIPLTLGALINLYKYIVDYLGSYDTNVFPNQWEMKCTEPFIARHRVLYYYTNQHPFIKIFIEAHPSIFSCALTFGELTSAIGLHVRRQLIKILPWLILCTRRASCFRRCCGWCWLFKIEILHRLNFFNAWDWKYIEITFCPGFF